MDDPKGPNNQQWLRHGSGLLQLRQDEEDLKDVRITVVDNYQGEECDVILLSLVRSNKDDAIGFLKTDNRVCVALSRARHGKKVL